MIDDKAPLFLEGSIAKFSLQVNEKWSQPAIQTLNGHRWLNVGWGLDAKLSSAFPAIFMIAIGKSTLK